MILMKRYLLRIGLVVTLLFGLSDSLGWVSNQEGATNKHQQEEQITQDDGYIKGLVAERQKPIDSPLVKSQNQQHVGSSRPSRIIPTYGGKTGKNLAHWASQHLDNTLNIIYLPLQLTKICSGHGIASPRLYYVIALRRILC